MFPRLVTNLFSFIFFLTHFSAATFCSNPQFAIKLEDVDDDPHDGKDGCTFLVGLMQKDGRKERRFGRDLNTIGFSIYQVQHHHPRVNLST